MSDLPNPNSNINDNGNANNAIDLNADISHLGLGYKTLGDLRNAEVSARSASRAGPQAPESYNFDGIIKKFGEVVNVDHPDHQAEVAFCRKAGMTQQQMEAHIGRFYQAGQDKFNQQTEAIKARDEALIKAFGSADNANTVLERVGNMGLETKNLNAEKIIEAHKTWEKNFGNGVGDVSGDSNTGGNKNPQYKPENTFTYDGKQYGFDPADLESINAFSQATIEVGKQKIPLTRLIPHAVGAVDRALRENAKIETDKENARRAAMDRIVDRELKGGF